MKKALVFLLVFVVMLQVSIPLCQGLGGANCEKVAAGAWYHPGIVAGCLYEIVAELAFEYGNQIWDWYYQ